MSDEELYWNMKTDYKDVHFVYAPRGSDETKKNWICLSKEGRYELGFVIFYNQWKQHVFITGSGGGVAMFSASCLRDIADFLEQLNKEKNVPNV